MKSLSSKTYQCGVTIQGLTTLSGTVYLTGITNTASWDHVIVGTTAQGQLYTRTYAQLMSDITSGIGLSGYVPTSRTLTINGVSYDLTANRSWTITTPYVSKLQHEVKAGVAINKGQAVYVTGADGTNMIVGLASNASEATSSKTMGLLDATVSTNGFANVVTEGLLAGLDTSTAGAAGDPVWLGTGGNLIYGLGSKPYAPAHLVFIGIVTRKNSNNGEIFVKVQNGFELKEIHDVDLITTTPVNGHLLGFDGTLWVNKTVAGWLGYTPANASGTTNYISKFTGSTTLGNSLVFDNGTNVGIGTVTPDSRLHIEGNTTGSGSGADAIVHIKQNGGWNGNEPWALYVEGYSYLNGFRVNAYDTQRGLYSDAGELGFAVGGNSPISFTQNTSDYRMYIAPGGNIGIGTTSPSYKLQVNGDGNGLYVLGANTAPYTQTIASFVYGGNGNSINIENQGGKASIQARAGGSTMDLLLNPAGSNVGIGTVSPSELLEVVGNIRANISNGGGFMLTGASASGLVRAGATGLALRTNTTDRLTIDNSGNVGIGTTSPGYKLEVNGIIKSGIAGNSSANYAALVVASAGTTTSQAAIAIQQLTSEGDTIIFGDYEPYVEYNFMHENASNVFHIHSGENTNSLGSNTFYNRSGNPRTGYIKWSLYQGNGDMHVGGSVGIGNTSPTTKLDVSGVITATGGNSTNWNTAYGWGNHASANYVPQARTLTINGTSYDLSANRSWTIATTTPGGSDTQVQYNSSGSLAGASALTYNSTTNRVGINQAFPGYDLDVNGQVRVQDKLRVGTGNGVVHMSSTATINASATTVVWAQTVSVGMCAFIEYYILNSTSLTDQRAGTIMVTWNQSGTPTITHTETTTPDIGSTTAVNFTSSLVGSDARINAVNSSANPYTMVMSYKYF